MTEPSAGLAGRRRSATPPSLATTGTRRQPRGAPLPHPVARYWFSRLRSRPRLVEHLDFERPAASPRTRRRNHLDGVESWRRDAERVGPLALVVLVATRCWPRCIARPRRPRPPPRRR